MKNFQQNIDLDSRNFPQRLRTFRENRHLSQSDLAEKAGLSYRTIHDLELGKRNRAQEKTLLLLAQALDVSLENLLNHVPPKGGSSSPRFPLRNPIWLAAGTLVIVALVVSLGLIWHKGRLNANWTLEKESFVVRDAVFGFKLWELPKGPFVHFCFESPWDSEQLLIGTTNLAPEGGRLFSLNRTSGDTTWIIQPDIEAITRAFGVEDVMSANFNCSEFRIGDLDGDGIPEVIIKFIHGLYYPCAIVVVGQGGVLLHQYANKGHLWDWYVRDIDQDGKDEVIATGVNNAKAHQGATVILLDDLHFRGASIDSLCDPWSNEPDSALIRLVLPQYPEPYMDLLQSARLASWNLQVFENGLGEKLLNIEVGGHDTNSRICVTVDSELHPIFAIPKDSFLELTISQWPDSLKNATGPGDPVWLAKWLSGYRRFEAGHWPPNNTRTDTAQ